MKHSRSLAVLLLAMTLTLTLSSCLVGYNPIMQDHLGDINNYVEYSGNYLDYIEGEYSLNFIMTFDKAPDNNLGYYYDYSDEYGTDVQYYMELCPANAEALKASGFFDEVAVNDPITIKVSPWIYMDGNFFFIISVKTADKVYLDEDTGLANMKEMMRKNPGLI